MALRNFFQYQVKAEPVNPDTRQTRFFQPLSDPSRSWALRRAAAFAVAIAATAGIVTPPTHSSATFNATSVQSVEPRFDKTFICQTKTEPVLVPAATTIITVHVEAESPDFYRGDFIYQTKTEPVFVPTVETVTVDKWLAPWRDPVPRRALPASEQQSLAWVRDFELVTVNKWFAPWREPVPRRALPASEQQALAFVKAEPFEAISTDKWFAPLSEPVRIKPGLRAHLHQDSAWSTFTPATPEAITIDKWYQAFSSPTPPKRGLGPQQQQTLAWVQAAPFEAIYADKWWAPWSEPVRPKSRISTHPSLFWSSFTPTIETVTVDKWFKLWQEPVRVRQQLGVAAQPASVFDPRAIVSLPWHQPFAEPVRTKRGLSVTAQSFLAHVPFAPVLEDMWHQAWSEPSVKVKRGLHPSRQPFIAFVKAAPFEPIYLDKWWQNWSEPSVKTKRGLHPGQYPFFTFSQFPPVTAHIDITLGTTESGDTAAFTFTVTTATSGTAVVSVVEIKLRSAINSEIEQVVTGNQARVSIIEIEI